MAAQKPKRGPVMRTETKMSEDRRQKMLREMLTRLRDETYERVSDFRRDQRDKKFLSSPIRGSLLTAAARRCMRSRRVAAAFDERPFDVVP